MNSKSYPKLQNGIYFTKDKTPPESFSLVFLRIAEGSVANDVKNALHALWSILNDLKKGIMQDVSISQRNRRSERLSVLIAYGPNVFNIPYIERKCPLDLLNSRFFKRPLVSGGGEVVENSNLYYDKDITENDIYSDHIVFQFIADNEFATSRAVVETWKHIQKQEQKVLELTKAYTGFQSSNKRNWMGFLDGISNIKPDHRLESIAIDKTSLPSEDKWMSGGTYLAFIRLVIDLASWEKINVSEQELIIGRDKETGCPLIGIDKLGRPVKDIRCPRRGTDEVIESGNEQFRNHPPFGYQKNKPFGVRDEVLKKSHVGLTQPFDPKRDTKKMPLIFRQGYQFLESGDEKVPFRLGLNFVSYQNSTQTILDVLKYGFVRSSPQPERRMPAFFDFISARHAGLFAVPPVNKDEYFPGESIFAKLNFYGSYRFNERYKRLG